MLELLRVRRGLVHLHGLRLYDRHILLPLRRGPLHTCSRWGRQGHLLPRVPYDGRVQHWQHADGSVELRLQRWVCVVLHFLHYSIAFSDSEHHQHQLSNVISNVFCYTLPNGFSDTNVIVDSCPKWFRSLRRRINVVCKRMGALFCLRKLRRRRIPQKQLFSYI